MSRRELAHEMRAGWVCAVHGPTDFTDEECSECSNFGFALRHVQQTVKKVTGCDRVYTAMIGETGSCAPRWEGRGGEGGGFA